VITKQKSKMVSKCRKNEGNPVVRSGFVTNCILVNLIIYIFKHSWHVCKHLPGIYQIFPMKLLAVLPGYCI